jgi:hypothetical protein
VFHVITDTTRTLTGQRSALSVIHNTRPTSQDVTTHAIQARAPAALELGATHERTLDATHIEVCYELLHARARLPRARRRTAGPETTRARQIWNNPA